MSRVRAHKVTGGGRKTFGRREHTRAPKPGSRERVAKPFGFRFRRKAAAGQPGPAPQQPKGQAPTSGKPIRLAAFGGAAILTFLALTVASAGSPLLVAAVVLVVIALRSKSHGGDTADNEGGQ